MLPFDFLTPQKKLISILLVGESSYVVEPSGNEGGKDVMGRFTIRKKGQSERRKSVRTSRWIG